MDRETCLGIATTMEDVHMRTIIFLGLLGCLFVLLMLSTDGRLLSAAGVLAALLAAFLLTLAFYSDESDVEG